MRASINEELGQAKRQCKPQGLLVLMGDCSGRLGEGREEDMVGPNGLGNRTLRGEKFVEWCYTSNQSLLLQTLISTTNKKEMDTEKTRRWK